MDNVVRIDRRRRHPLPPVDLTAPPPPLPVAFAEMEATSASHSRRSPIWERARRRLMSAGYILFRDGDMSEQLAVWSRSETMFVQAVLDATAVARAVSAGRALPPRLPPGSWLEGKDEAAEVLRLATALYNVLVEEVAHA